MNSRFADIKFNLLRAIEIFQDLNEPDLDVTAPLSSPDGYKEKYVAERLSEFLTQLIEDKVFDDCESRDDDESSEQEELSEASHISTPDSEGFDYDPGERNRRASKESLTGRIKRYVRRIMPGRRQSNPHELDDQLEPTSSEVDDDSQMLNPSRSTSGRSSRRASDRGSQRSSSLSSESRQAGRAGRSRTRRVMRGASPDDSRQSSMSDRAGLSTRGSDSPPYDPQLVHGHRHFHKHNHPNSHHHHDHSGSHSHSYHRHSDEPAEEEISDDFRAESTSNDELSSGPLASRSTSRSRSSSSRRGSSSSRRSR